MSFKTAWRCWRLKVHDILEVGGDAHPVGRIVNVFLVSLIIANGIAFTAPAGSMCWTARALRVSVTGTPRSSST